MPGVSRSESGLDVNWLQYTRADGAGEHALLGKGLFRCTESGYLTPLQGTKRGLIVGIPGRLFHPALFCMAIAEPAAVEDGPNYVRADCCAHPPCRGLVLLDFATRHLTQRLQAKRLETFCFDLGKINGILRKYILK